MKLSRYNIEKKEDKSCLIYNTVTSAILELDTDYEKSYYEMKEGKKCSKPDLESALLEGGMLVEDDKDEFAELLIRNKIERFADSNLTLTIAPTMACNFCCPYCYEKGREYITMSETVQDQLTSQLSAWEVSSVVKSTISPFWVMSNSRAFAPSVRYPEGALVSSIR